MASVVNGETAKDKAVAEDPKADQPLTGDEDEDEDKRTPEEEEVRPLILG